MRVRRLGLVLAAGLVVGVVLAGVAGGPAEAAAGSGVVAGPARPVGYSAHVVGQLDPGRYVRLIEAGGATSVRDDVRWALVEPARGRFNWAGPDEIVAQAAAHHLHPLLIVDTSPVWASGGSPAGGDGSWLPPRRPADYARFAAAVAARYRAGGVFWRRHPFLPRYLLAGLELWNEENSSRFWGGRAPSPRRYAAMVRAAYPAIKRADPAVTVVIGGLAPAGAYRDVACSGHRGSGYDAAAWNPVSYLQALYADGIGGRFDALGWHFYDYWTGATAAQMLAYNRCSAWTQLAGTRVSARSLMIAHGDAAKRIWITETGAPTCVRAAAYACVSPAQQAALAAAEARLWKSLAWAGGFYWYDIRDVNAGPRNAESHFGTVLANNTPKPAYRALQHAWRLNPARNPATL